MIDGVKVKQLRVIADDRGRLMEILRADDEFFDGFGQVYLTTVMPGVVKGWHFHELQSDNIACVQGMLKVALYDPREGSPTKGDIDEYYVGIHSPKLIHIPPSVYHGFKAVSLEEALVINTVTKMYDYDNPDEKRCDPHGGEIPYDWSRKDR